MRLAHRHIGQAAAQNQHDRPALGARVLMPGMAASLYAAEWSAPGTEQTTSVSLKGHCKDRGRSLRP